MPYALPVTQAAPQAAAPAKGSCSAHHGKGTGDPSDLAVE
jgi:hypothetical protein